MNYFAFRRKLWLLLEFRVNANLPDASYRGVLENFLDNYLLKCAEGWERDGGLLL